MVSISAAEFEEWVGDALDLVPQELLDAMDDVVVLTATEPTHEQLDQSEDPHAELLGLYEGTPLTERDSWWAAGSLPDRITIFRGPAQRCFETREEAVEEIAVTVIHEIAHHFGIDDQRLHELGWG